MRKIRLSQGKFALVDDADFEWLNQWKWSAETRHGIWYAVRHTSKADGSKPVRMHRVIMQPPQGKFVDHRDGDGLNNQRCNLRNATRAENGINHKKSRANKSGYMGVRKRGNRWQARVGIDHQEKHIGYFSTAEEAARAYNVAVLSQFGEFARLNHVR